MSGCALGGGNSSRPIPDMQASIYNTMGQIQEDKNCDNKVLKLLAELERCQWRRLVKRVKQG